MRDEQRDNDIWLSEIMPTAMQRVGGTQADQLAWLLRFAQRPDLAGLKGQALDMVLGEMAYFVFARGGVGPNFNEKPKVSAATAQGIARSIKEGLRAKADGGIWEFELRGDVSSRALFGFLHTTEGDPKPIWLYRGRFRGVFLAHAMDIVANHFDAIQRCKRADCGKLFVRTDQRQQYCEQNCSTLERQNKFRAKGKGK
jgi:hypothetical protein